MRSLGLTSLGVLVALTVSPGCHSGSSAPPPVKDAQVYDLSIDLPPGCPPATANEKGVGIPCTKGGGQCTKSGMPPNLLCTCDPLPLVGAVLEGVPCICTIGGANATTNPNPCSVLASGICGSDATCCNYMKEGYYCSPNVCLPGGSCINFTAADAGN